MGHRENFQRAMQDCERMTTHRLSLGLGEKPGSSSDGLSLLSRGTNGFQILSALARMEAMAPVHHIGPDIEAGATARMRQAGPLIIVQIKDPASGRESAPLFAMIDTGASISAIDEEVAAAVFGGAAGNPAAAHLATGPIQTRELDVEITVPEIEAKQLLLMITTPLAKQGVHVLLGRDFLADKVMIYDGKSGRVTLCR